MPEGDTIFKVARTLEAVLAGKALIKVSSTLPQIASAHLAGCSIRKVEARGKNLLIHLDDERVFWTHLRMSGSWHVYRAGEKWQRPRRQMRLALDVEGFCAVCFNAPVVELLTPLQLRGEKLLRVGPDGSAELFDAAECERRLRALGELPIGEAIVRQDALGGLGNVLKSELLFSEQLDPFASIGSLADTQLAHLVASARQLLLDNRHSSTRITRPSLEGPGTRWVYGRQGEPCRQCGETVRMKRQGPLLRSTYFCARCQEVSG